MRRSKSLRFNELWKHYREIYNRVKNQGSRILLKLWKFLQCLRESPYYAQMRLFAIFPASVHLKGALLLLLCSFFSACGERKPSVDGGQSTETNKDVDQLVILTWDEYFSNDVVANFESEFGIDVKFVTFNNLDEMEAMLRSRPAEFDLALTTSGKLPDLIDLQLIRPIQKELIPLYGNLDSKFLGLTYDPENKFSVPYMWGPTLVAYRSDKIEDPAKTWKSLWNEKYKGHVLMLDEVFDTYSAALFALGHDINSQDPKHLEEATNLLLSQVEMLDSGFVDIFEIRNKLLSGECWITMTYSSDAAVLADEQETIRYFIPDEGASLWLDCFVVPRESQRVESAHLFLNYFCRPEVAAANSNELWCASANREVKPLLTPEIIAEPTLYLSDEVFERCQFEAQSTPSRHMIVNQGFKRIFDRVRSVKPSPAPPQNPTQ